MELETIRKEIDFLDNELLKIITKRMALMPEIVKIKKELNLPIHQPKREASLLAERMAVAKSLDLDPEMVKKLFQLIVANARKIQEEII